MFLLIKLVFAFFLLAGLACFLLVLPFRLMRHAKALMAPDECNPLWITSIELAGTLVLLWGIGQGLFEWNTTDAFDPQHHLFVVLAGLLLVAAASRFKARHLATRGTRTALT
jgi:hypothetical protein